MTEQVGIGILLEPAGPGARAQSHLQRRSPHTAARGRLTQAARHLQQMTDGDRALRLLAPRGYQIAERLVGPGNLAFAYGRARSERGQDTTQAPGINDGIESRSLP